MTVRYKQCFAEHLCNAIKIKISPGLVIDGMDSWLLTVILTSKCILCV